MHELEGRVAVVTGGASGIGLALAKRWIAEGMRVVIADLRRDALDAAVRELEAAGGEVLRCAHAGHPRKMDLIRI